jgi:HEAT repeat protein
VRYYALRALARRVRHPGETPVAVAAALVARATSDAAPPVRIAAIETLAELRVRDALPVLAKLAADDDANVAVAAGVALKFFGATPLDAL